MQNGEYAELRAFRAVAEQGSFIGAANLLRVTPSALSQIIRRMEDRLHTRLFNRTTRSVRLTEAGQRLHARLRPALEELDAALNETREQAGTLAGTVKLHSTSIGTDSVLAPVIGDFHTMYPDIVLDIIVEDAVIDVTAAGFDAGISLGEYVQKDMIAYPLGPDLRMIAAATPQYLAQHGTPATPADLQHHACINWRYLHEKTIYRWEFFQQGHWISMAVDGPLITTRRELAVSAALQHMGIVFWTENMLTPWLNSGQLVPLLNEYCPPFLGWHLYYPRQRHTSKALRALIDFLRHAYPLPEKQP